MKVGAHPGVMAYIQGVPIMDGMAGTTPSPDMTGLVFQKQVLEPCIAQYEKVLRFQGRGESETAALLEAERQKLETGERFALPRLIACCTTKCTLNCKECSALIPYYPAPYSADPEELIQTCAQILDVADVCYVLEIATGEVLLYPHIGRLLTYFLEHPKVLLVEVTTNGTYVPKEELVPLLQHPRLLVNVSDYGDVASLGRLAAFFEKNRVRFHVHANMQWTSMDGFQQRRSRPEQLREQMLRCQPSKMCNVVYGRRLYRCQTAAGLTELGMAKDAGEPFIEVEPSDSPAALRAKLEAFRGRGMEEVCACCTFGTDGQTVPPAQQMEGMRPYSRYTLVERAEYEGVYSWAKELQEAKNWLEAQQGAANAALAELKAYTSELQQGKDWLEGQYNNYKALYEELAEKEQGGE